MTTVCLATDLHMIPPVGMPAVMLMETRLATLRTALSACSLVIYAGDILTMDSCDAVACDEHIALARRIVDHVGRPFMFTLGNHDGAPEGADRMRLRETLNASVLHTGLCDPSLDACVHRELGIATLYSGKTGCHAATHYGCPNAETASWVDATLAHRPEAFTLLVTHIPPPNVLGLSVTGVVGEHVCCWDEWAADDTVLPRRKPLYHAFGHDHSNLFVTSAEQGSGTRYLAAFKSGWAPSSYDAAYYRGEQGFTMLNVSTHTASFITSVTMDGEDLLRFYTPNNVQLQSQARCCPNVHPLRFYPPPPLPAPPPPMPDHPTPRLPPLSPSPAAPPSLPDRSASPAIPQFLQPPLQPTLPPQQLPIPIQPPSPLSKPPQPPMASTGAQPLSPLPRISLMAQSSSADAFTTALIAFGVTCVVLSLAVALVAWFVRKKSHFAARRHIVEVSLPNFPQSAMSTVGGVEVSPSSSSTRSMVTSTTKDGI